MANDEKHSPVEENKTAKDEKQSSVSATELAQALIEALQKNTMNRGVTRAITEGTRADDAITQYKKIFEDLETIKLLR
jgi:phytoene/squalene synthetase